MKTVTLIFLAVMLVLSGCTSCKQVVDANGLPPATQEGKNTLGFLLNGKPWMPKGFSNLTPNLNFDYDEGYKNGMVGIDAYRTENNVMDAFGIFVKDSLNFFNAPITIPISKKSLCLISIEYKNCSIDYYDTAIYRNGSLTITKLDRPNGIISGLFNAILYKQGCIDTIRITEGRFDMKWH